MKFLLILFFLIPLLAAEEKKVTIATTDWPPYYGKNLRQGGPITELTNTAFKKVGLKTKVLWVPWARAQELVKNGNMDILMGCYKTPEREKVYSFSNEPLGYAVTGIYSLNDRVKKVSTLEELDNVHVCHLIKTSVDPNFDKSTSIKKTAVSTEVSCLKMLIANRVDAIAGSQFVFKTLLKQIKANVKLKTILTFNKTPMYNAISKKINNHKKLKDAFDKGLNLIKKDQTYEKIMKKHGF